MNYFYNLPRELQQYIYEFDSTFKNIYNNVVKELNRYNYVYKEI